MLQHLNQMVDDHEASIRAPAPRRVRRELTPRSHATVRRGVLVGGSRRHALRSANSR